MGQSAHIRAWAVGVLRLRSSARRPSSLGFFVGLAGEHGSEPSSRPAKPRPEEGSGVHVLARLAPAAVVGAAAGLRVEVCQVLSPGAAGDDEEVAADSLDAAAVEDLEAPEFAGRGARMGYTGPGHGAI